MSFPVEDYCQEQLQITGRVESHNGEQLICRCPECGKAKLYIHATTGMWTCFRCDSRGGPAGLIVLAENVSFRVAKAKVRESTTLPTRSIEQILRGTAEAPRRPVAPPEPLPPALALPEGFTPCYEPVEARWRMPLYLAQRRIPRHIAAAYGLGYCEKGRYAGRLIIPAMEYGKLVFFQGRSMRPDANVKYLSPPVSRHEHVLGFDQATGARRVVVVEGPFDVLGCARAGIAAVGLLGKRCSPAQARLLASAFESAVVLLDADASKAAHEVASVLEGAFSGEVLIGRLESGGDPGDAPSSAVQAAVEGARPATLRGRLGL